MAEVITLVLLWIAIGFSLFCTYKIGEIKGKDMYFDKFFEEKIHSQELFLKCREKISKEDFEEIKDFHISHLTKGMEEEDGRD
jgi:hypothetical protein